MTLPPGDEKNHANRDNKQSNASCFLPGNQNSYNQTNDRANKQGAFNGKQNSFQIKHGSNIDHSEQVTMMFA